MRKYFLFFLFVNLFVFSCCSIEKSDFISSILSDIPEPRENEFKNYELLVDSYFNSINTNSPEIALKCIAVKEKYKTFNVTSYANYVGKYEVSADSPIPTADLYNLFLKINSELYHWNKSYMYLLVLSNNDLMNKILKYNDPEWDNKINKIASMRKIKNYSKPVIKKVYKSKVNSIQKEMNIEESLLLLINVEVDGEEMPDINMNIIKIGSNWRIYNVM